MNKIKSLIGIVFFLITATILIGNNQKSTNLSNTSIKEGNSSIVLSPITAATTNYELALNITWGGSDPDPYPDSGSDIAFDNSGNIYIVGTTTYKSAGGEDAFVAKYDSNGNSLLNITWGFSDKDQGTGIALDSSGNIYICGNTESIGAGGSDAFVAKFNSTGKSKFNITWGGSSGDYGKDIALDVLGNIYIVGTTYSKGAGSSDAFVAKFDSTKNSVFNITWGGSNEDEGSRIILDDLGNIYIVGTTSSKGAGFFDAFVAKYNCITKQSLLNITWGTSNRETGTGIALDKVGNIYISGTNYSSGDLLADAFATKFDSFTNKSILNITWDGSNNDLGHDIALDDSGNIYIVGRTTRFGFFDVFYAKYNSLGKILLNITWGGNDNDDAGSNIALDGSGNVYITGYNDHIIIGIPGYTDAFIIKYNVVHEYIPPSDDDNDDDDKKSPIIISGYNILFLIGFLTLSVVLLIKKRLK